MPRKTKNQAASADGTRNGRGDDSADAGRRVATIDRAADVLFLFAGDRPTLGVTEIAEDLSISKAVVHRILTSLKDRDLVVSDPTTRKYSLGPAVLELAARYREQLDVRGPAMAAMERLSAATNETATLSIRNGWQRIYIEQVTPPLEVKMTVRLGVGYPLHAGSSSKAFLAFLSRSEQDAFFAATELSEVTDATVTSETALRKELATIRERGYAVSLGERQSGAGSVAAPILDRREPIAVMSVCGPIERFRPKMEDAAKLLVEETRSISSLWGRPA